jgi:hypothetical protein
MLLAPVPLCLDDLIMMKPFKVPGGQGDVQTGCCDTDFQTASHVSLHWSQQQLSQDVSADTDFLRDKVSVVGDKLKGTAL